jgi:hypothetical protein
MRPIHLFFTLWLLLASCSLTPVPTDSGIVGQVIIGPTCPVEMPGLDCADKPYQATLTVLTPSGNKVNRFTTEADGTFRVNLAPGDYILHPESPGDMGLPYGTEQAFTVVPGQFAQLLVMYDSGIR